MERRILPMVRDFNPRSHAGSDPAGAGGGGEPGISIHAPTRGATCPDVF